jgi:predicted N-acetyltransferase YhbS
VGIALGERLLPVIARFGLDANDFAAGVQRSSRERASRQQATAAETHQQIIETADLFDQVVLGHPSYYPRFGFSALLAKLLEAPYSGDSFMALELKPGSINGLKWHVAYPRAFASL